jgi:magnesium chelatase family protein
MRERRDGAASHAGWVAAVGRARARARARQGPRDNAALSPEELERSVPLDADALRLLTRADARSPLSARAIQALRRVARTLADLEDEEQVTSAHLARALALRAPL